MFMIKTKVYTVLYLTGKFVLISLFINNFISDIFLSRQLSLTFQLLFFSIKETAELHKRQQEYQQKQVAMTKDDEEEYFNYCSEAMFRIHILEMRLNRFYSFKYQKILLIKVSYFLVMT